VEDTSVLEVSDLGISIESAGHSQGLAAVGCDFDILSDLEVTTLHVDVELLVSGKTVGVSVFTGLELHGEDSHTNEV
jgi:hypothetical protein